MKNLIESDILGGITGLLILLCFIVMIIAAAKKKPVILQLTLGIVFILMTGQLIIEALAFAKHPVSVFTLSFFAGVFLIIGIKTFLSAGKTYKKIRAGETIDSI